MSIKAQGLTRSFGEVRALNGVNLDLAPGRVYGLVGPNGSGKTTLLLILAGLLAPDSGSAQINGYDIMTDSANARAQLGWMPDDFGMWDSLTCTEILETFARFYHLPEAMIPQRVHELLEMAGLLEKATMPVSSLSRGQKQRLGFARVIIQNPAVLLLDEPTNGMDPRSRMRLRDQLRAYARAGATVVVSSHVLSELEGMIDEPVMINQGRNVALPQSTGVRWMVRASNPQQLAQWAQSIGLAFEFQMHNGREYFLCTLRSEEDAPRLLQDLTQAGISVLEFQAATNQLEAAFLNLEGSDD
ncbi:hypothetical protein BSR29_07190 [Boudabousia liubingyangii]|uniref:ABC transporter domain-containing protein n=1 Tax=Boudabousia liubingyangii TaxID=1921764 RepID=A0A1Q5PK54_9ACTO|nr:ABC transporter ATP-binding protein [Boudabousia liubingyangii]OKL46600.1 hypothetical protein BSR29_07190 [Boudabousia liubingyangii]